MPGPLLYSTNVFLKLLIQEKFRNDIHYVWCSEYFDSTKAPGYSSASTVPASSNPADIFRELTRAVKSSDHHCAKIEAQKLSLLTLAASWEGDGSISPDSREDMTFMVNNAGFSEWRPLLYIIPRETVKGRMKPVPAAKRAGIGDEFIVDDLKRSEFDVIEL